ncbi:site-specific integrase [Nakamurella silvestris]|nr:site-specific integrase [Nakamurella silvestris]
MGNVEDRWMMPDPDDPGKDPDTEEPTKPKRIRTLRYGKGKRWRAEWVEPDGTRRKMSFTTKDAAAKYLINVESKKLDGTYVPVARARVTVGELWVGWRAGKNRLRPTTLATYDSLWAKHIQPKWSTVPVGQIRRPAVEQWMANLTQEKWVSTDTGRKRITFPLSGSQSRRAGMILSSLLDLAVQDKNLPSNPLDKLTLPSTRTGEKVPLADDQVHALTAAMGPHSLEVWTLVKTGMRWGEMAALLVRDLVMDRKRILIHRGYVEAKGKRHYLETKTAKHREVPVSGDHFDALVLLAAGRKPDDLLFPGPAGNGWTKTLWRRRWNAARVAIGEQAIGTHILRHTAASRLIRAGADPKVVQRMLGHSSAAMTMDLYGHLFDNSLDDVAERMALIFDLTAERSSPPSRPPGSRAMASHQAGSG